LTLNPYQEALMALSSPSPFLLSIEPVDGPAFRSGFHLGTDEALARAIAVERFHGRNAAGMATVTVALLRDDRLVDVYDGTWASDAGDQFELDL